MRAKGTWLALAALLMAACGEPQGLPSAGAGDDPVGFAVVCSDYGSSQVALLQPDGLTPAADPLIHSGSHEAGLVLALSGDVVLPTVNRGQDVLVIDRTHGVLTWVAPGTAVVTRQLSVAQDFAANPHDVLELEDGRLLVTRYDRAPGEFTGGDDVAVLAADGAVSQSISFSTEPGVRARPDRLLSLGDRVLVSLNHGSPDYTDWSAGRYATLREVDGLWAVDQEWTLPEVRNCGGLAADGDRFAVVCTGTYEAGMPLGDGSGVILSDENGVESARLLGSDPRVAGALAPAVAFADGAVWLVRYGELGGRGDAVLRWDPEQDAVESALELEGAFAIESLASLDDGGVLVPVGLPEDPRVCRLNAAGWTCGSVCAGSGLPPRSLRALDEPG